MNNGQLTMIPTTPYKMHMQDGFQQSVCPFSMCMSYATAIFSHYPQAYSAIILFIPIMVAKTRIRFQENIY